MEIGKLVFYYLAFAMVISGMGAVFSKNPVHTVLFVLVLVLHQALLLLTLGSEFLAAVQVIVYAGAVLVLFLFVVYLINLKKEELKKRFIKGFSPCFFVFLLFLLIAAKTALFIPGLTSHFEAHLPFSSGSNTLYSIARYLFQRYLFQFELIGVVLLVVVLGAVFLLRRLENPREEGR